MANNCYIYFYFSKTSVPPLPRGDKDCILPADFRSFPILDPCSEKSLEGGGTAFDAETDSEMNSQESRSDLEDMEDEDGTRSPALEPSRARSEAPESLNGPLGPSEASIASNLQAMSTQMFQTKRCFRLAPTFSNLLLQPTTEAAASASLRRCVNGDVDRPSEPGAWASVRRPALVHTSVLSALT